MKERPEDTVSAASDWESLEETLAEGTVRGKRSPAAEAELEGFDAAELEVLRRLATRARLSRTRAPLTGNVVFLHGITGSDLAAVTGGARDDVWISLPRIIRGYIKRLELAPDGATEVDRTCRVVATRPNKRYYARAILSLRARWNVEGFAYDWRKDIDDAADELARFITAKFPGKPVHLVAHSMGGLVARNMIRRHPQVWEAMQDPELATGGRLVMLGTPNYGSFAIVQAMTGEDRMMSLLEKCDIKHGMSELLAITNTFVGSYQLLPSPAKLPPTLIGLYQEDTWPKAASISQAHLNRAYAFHGSLDTTSTINATRMIYVAGCQRPTIVGMNIAGRGDFDYVLSHEGDGRVPHELGLLKGVPTWYVDEVHGDLARNENVLRALDDLLGSGTTGLLWSRAPSGAKRAAPSMRDYRSASDRALLDELERIAVRVRERGDPTELTAEELYLGEDAIIRAALGAGRASRARVRDGVSDRAVPEARLVPLRVTLKLADIREIKTPAAVVGHYRGMQPINAIGAIDRRLDGWISLAVKQGMILGDLGELFFVPTRGRIGPDAIVVAGMGIPGTFSEDALRVLMTNVALGIGALGHKSFATVLVGAGEGNLKSDLALRALISGVANGINGLPGAPGHEPALREVTIVELDADRVEHLSRQLQSLKDDRRLGARLQVRVPTAAELQRWRQQRKRGAAAQRASSTTQSVPRLNEVRLTLESPEDGKGRFRFSAIMRSAVVPVREVDIDPSRFRALAQVLQEADAGADQEQYGRLLFEYLMPEDFDQPIEQAESVRLIVDSTTASFPWEMACFRPRGGAARMLRLGLEKRLTRQFRTMLSRPPGTMPSLNNEVRILVIADPAPEQELQLPFARREGRRVVEALRRLSTPSLRIDVESRIGPSECSLVEILKLILTGDFDVVHFAGHGDYDPANPAAAGWILSRDQVLTARDIFRARRVPRLVFANACFSGVIHAGPAFAADELVRGIATVAQAFFERGVPNYIGSGWPVDDEQAGTFSVRFYEEILAGRPMRDAMYAARQTIFDEGIGATWGAYQHYGDPDDVLVVAKAPQAQQAPRGRGRSGR